MTSKKKRRLLFKRKRTLDPTLAIDYKNPDLLRRFITDRGKIIPRRISGASSKQQRVICKSIKRARYLSLLPYSLAHRSERTFAAEMSAIANAAGGSGPKPGGRGRDGGGHRGGRDDHRGGRDDHRGRDDHGGDSNRN